MFPDSTAVSVHLQLASKKQFAEYNSHTHFELLVCCSAPALHAKEHASTKKMVGNALALNLVQQLFSLGAIDAARAPGTKKPTDTVSHTHTHIHTHTHTHTHTHAH